MGASHWTGGICRRPAMDSAPHFSFWRPKKRNGPRPVQREKTLCRAPVQWPSARTGVFRDSADQTCQSSAGSRRTTHLSHPCAAYLVRRKTGVVDAWPLLLNPLPLYGPVKAFPAGGHAGPPLRENKKPPSSCRGRPVCRPLSREGRSAAATAQPFAALPPYAGQPSAASPRYGCRVPLAGRCGVPLAGKREADCIPDFPGLG